jgi:hypothetical protein
MTSLKLKFKIQTLHKILKHSTLEDSNLKNQSLLDSKNKGKPLSAKSSVRNSKVINTDYETLPGFESQINKLSLEEKDEILTLIKNIEFTSLISIFTLLNNHQFYSKLKSKIGLEILKNSFKEIIKNKSDLTMCIYDTHSQSTTRDSLFINDECELFFYLKDILDLSELDAMDIYDVFKFNEFFAITEKNFIILIFLLASYESGKLEDFFTIFPEEMFSCLSANERCINVSRLKEVGRILGFEETVMTKVTNDLNLEFNSLVDLNKFREFYINLAKLYDENFKAQSNAMVHQGQGGSPGKGKVNDPKIKTSGCMNKACNIL